MSIVAAAVVTAKVIPASVVGKEVDEEKGTVVDEEKGAAEKKKLGRMFGRGRNEEEGEKKK